LGKVFTVFFKKYLARYYSSKSELDNEIAYRTLESIFGDLDNFKGHERHMEGSFSNFCKTIFKRRRADVFREKQGLFEADSIDFEHEILADDPNVEKGHSLIENVSYGDSVPSQKASGTKLFEPDLFLGHSFTNQEKHILFQQVISTLEKMAFDGHDCADFLLKYYDFLKQGLKQKEMAKKLGLLENTFNVMKRRCIGIIANAFE